MKKNRKPNYLNYFNILPITKHFSHDWYEKLSLDWVDVLNLSENENKYSRVFGDDNFPTYWNWSQDFRNEYENCTQRAFEQNKLMAEQAEKIFDRYSDSGFIIYAECPDGFSYIKAKDYEGYPFICRIDDDQQDCEYEFDSGITASYAFINDYLEWEEHYGDAYKNRKKLQELEALRTNINNYNSNIGEVSECDYCGNMGYIVQEIKDNDICSDCSKKLN